MHPLAVLVFCLLALGLVAVILMPLWEEMGRERRLRKRQRPVSRERMSRLWIVDTDRER